MSQTLCCVMALMKAAVIPDRYSTADDLMVLNLILIKTTRCSGSPHSCEHEEVMRLLSWSVVLGSLDHQLTLSCSS